jgi:NTE family protein
MPVDQQPPFPADPLTVPAKLRQVEAEAWEGGGFLGHAYGPLIEAFDRYGLNIRRHAGTSAGAITALLRSLGVTAEQVRLLQEETPWARFASYRPPALIRLVSRGGWHSIDYARGWIADRVREAGLPDGVTFKALRRRTGRDLLVGATRYQRHRGGPVEAEPFVFSPELTPDAPVSDAVLASMAVPLFWPPVEVSGWWFCDGGVAMNHPLAVFAELPCEAVIGARLDSGQEILFAGGDVAVEPARPGVGEIVLANGEMLRSVANRTFVPAQLWERIIRIDVGRESALDFRSGADRIGRLRAAGTAALSSWLDHQPDGS